MENTNIVASDISVVTGEAQTANLNQVIDSSITIRMEDAKELKVRNGYRVVRLISRGANSKLSASVAVTVPALAVTASNLGEILASGKYPELASYMVAAISKLQEDVIRSQLEASGKASIGAVVQHASIELPALESYLVTTGGSGSAGIGQLSAERITNWFDSEARELLIVALADRLGISDSEVTDATVARLEAIASQMRENLAKLSSKKAVSFDPRVKEALNWALSIATMDAADSSSIAVRLATKLNAPVPEAVSLADALGF